MMSVAAPAVSGTMARMGLVGQACGQALAMLQRTMAQASKKRRMSTSLSVADRRNLIQSPLTG
jgi:hypothetical protein